MEEGDVAVREGEVRPRQGREEGGEPGGREESGSQARQRRERLPPRFGPHAQTSAVAHMFSPISK